ncbi:MAG TPA: hypothetical protein VN960_01160 [Gaiellaceae bacterium]|jgi:hypothetical protein|nr:hypothetical protein [Gaiellaceae bacterium]
MPNHWRPIDPDNPDAKKREKEVKDAVEKFGGTVSFVGCKKGTRDWFLLADVTNVKQADMAKMETEARVKKNVAPEVWLTPDELPPPGA